jgi:predicted Zn-dependent protease
VSDSPRKARLEAMLADDPHDPFLLYGLAMEYVSAGDNAGAVERFNALFDAAPDYVPGYLQAAQALARLDRPADARAVLQRGMTVARQQRDQHAHDEMNALLESLPS